MCVIPSTENTSPNFLLSLLRALRHLRRWIPSAVGLGPSLQPSAPDGIVMWLVSLFCCTSFPYSTCSRLCSEAFTRPQKTQYVYSRRDRKMSPLQTSGLFKVNLPAEGKCDFPAFWSQYHQLKSILPVWEPSLEKLCLFRTLCSPTFPVNHSP